MTQVHTPLLVMQIEHDRRAGRGGERRQPLAQGVQGTFMGTQLSHNKCDQQQRQAFWLTIRFPAVWISAMVYRNPEVGAESLPLCTKTLCRSSCLTGLDGGDDSKGCRWVSNGWHFPLFPLAQPWWSFCLLGLSRCGRICCERQCAAVILHGDAGLVICGFFLSVSRAESVGNHGRFQIMHARTMIVCPWRFQKVYGCQR